MKKHLLIAFLTLSTLSSFAITRETSMVPILSDADDIVKLFEQEKDMEIVRMEFDILSTTKSTTRVLSKGWNYFIIAFGDYRFKDIDLKVYRNDNGSWTLVDQDNESNEFALVAISPEYNAEYKIEITAYSFKEGYNAGHYGLVIAHE